MSVLHLLGQNQMSVDHQSLRAIPTPRFSYRSLVVVLVVIWGLGDALSTLFALELTGSVSHETNPLVRALLTVHPSLLVILKAAVVACAGGLLVRYRPTIEQVPGWRAWFLTVITVGSAVVATNCYTGVAAVL